MAVSLNSPNASNTTSLQISSSRACGCAPMNATRQPSPTSNEKTLASPSLPQRQRRPQQGTCQWPEVSEPPSPP
eukprot:11227861-Lingulodinium_polyedra.AAC.1